jgi:hypothetical protein
MQFFNIPFYRGELEWLEEESHRAGTTVTNLIRHRALNFGGVIPGESSYFWSDGVRDRPPREVREFLADQVVRDVVYGNGEGI